MSKREIQDMAKAAGLTVDEQILGELDLLAISLRECKWPDERLSSDQVRVLADERDRADLGRTSSSSKTKSQKRFVLFNREYIVVEMMVALVILGSTVAILLQNTMGRISKSNANEAKIQMKEIGKQIDLFRTDCERFPTNEEGLEVLFSADALKQPCPKWSQYIKRVPKDPWNSNYIYSFDGVEYRLKSLGRGGREGGTGSEADISSDDL